jgi:hypothetical protein
VIPLQDPLLRGGRPRDERVGPREAGGSRYQDGTPQSSWLAYAIPSDAYNYAQTSLAPKHSRHRVNAIGAQPYAHSCELSIETVSGSSSRRSASSKPGIETDISPARGQFGTNTNGGGATLLGFDFGHRVIS